MRQRSRVMTRTTATLASSAMLAAGMIALAPQAAQAAPHTHAFEYADGIVQGWDVPADVHQVTITVKGAEGGQGGKQGGSPGRGGSGTFTLNVEPGDHFDFGLGGHGHNADTVGTGPVGGPGISGGPQSGGYGGFGANGPGPLNGGAGGGGGAGTEVRYTGGISTDKLILVAGGGGGGGGRNYLSADAGNGGGADANGEPGSGGSDGGKVGDSASTLGEDGDTAVLNLGGGGGGGGGGGYEGASGGDTIGGTSGAGGGGGRNYFASDAGLTQVGSWSANTETNGSVRISYNQAFTTTTTIANPGTVVTQEMKGYAIHVAGNGGQTPVGTVKLTAKNLGNGIVTDLGTEALDNQDATVFSDKLKVGTYTLSAEFIPTPGSDSLASIGKEALTVSKGDTTTLVSGPLDPPNFGDVVDLGVSVSPVDPAQGVPTGTVKFTSNGVVLGAPVVLDGSGKAVLSTNRLPVGTHDIIATYSGDKEFNSSGDETSLANFTVNQGDVTVELTSVHNPVIAGEKSKFDVKVTSNKNTTDKPTGTVTFYIDETAISGALPIDYAGKVHFEAELPVTNPDAHHHVTAVYSGDDNFHTATSNYVDQIVNFGSAKVALSSNLNPSHAGNDVTFSIDVSGNLPTQPYEPTGQVQLYVNGSAFDGPVDIDGAGKAQITTDKLPVGSNHVTARYLGDAKYKEAESGELIQVVKKQLVAVTLSANATDLQYGETLTLTAHVATEKGDVAVGWVQFYDNGVEVKDPVLVDGEGNAVISSDKVSKGVHQYSAKYFNDGVGDGKTEDGVSNTVQVTIHPNLLSIKLVTNRVPAYEGDDVLVQARVTPAADAVGKIAGSLQYYSDDKKIGGPVLISGTYFGSRTLKGLKPGTHRIVARFTPSSSSPFDGKVSNGLIQKVYKGRPNTKIQLTTNRVSLNKGTFKVWVRKSNGQAAPGYVHLYIDGQKITSLKLNSSGRATYVRSGLPDQQLVIVAVYPGPGKLSQVGKAKSLRRYIP